MSKLQTYILRRLAFICLIHVSLNNLVFAQDSTNVKIDSLIVLLMNDNKDTQKVNVYNQLSNEYVSINFNKSLEYSRLAKSLAAEIDYNEGLLKACMQLGFLEMSYFINYKEAGKNLNEALAIATKLGDNESLLQIYSWLSYVSNATKNFESALEYNEEAQEIANQISSDTKLSDLYAYRGGILEEMGDTSQAIEMYGKVLDLEKKNNFRETSNASRIVIARYYLLQDDFENALKYYRIAIKTFERSGDNRWLSYTHSEMADMHVIQKNFEQAEQHGLKGLELADSFGYKKEMADNCRVLVKVYTQMDSTHLVTKYQERLDKIDINLNLTIQAPIDGEEALAHSEPKEKQNPLMRILYALLYVSIVMSSWFIIRVSKNSH